MVRICDATREGSVLQTSRASNDDDLTDVSRSAKA